MASADATANGLGVITIPLANRLRTALANGAAITLTKPTAAFRCWPPPVSGIRAPSARSDHDPRRGDLMKSLDAGTIAALAAKEVYLVTLVKIAFPSGTIALNASNFTLTWNGDTYLGAAGIGSIAPTEDVPGQVTGATLELLQMDTPHIAWRWTARTRCRALPSPSTRRS
jgi:hypothetical protein